MKITGRGPDKIMGERCKERVQTKKGLYPLKRECYEQFCVGKEVTWH